jgi:glycosyltransferase involved in cell wall biosynthesis
MNRNPTILIAATVPIHLRAFHLPWVKRLRELGCTVIGIADRIRDMPECATAFNEAIDVPFSRNPLQFLTALRSQNAVSRILNKHAVDLVHVHTPVAAFVTRKAAHPFRRRGLKSIYTAHGFHFHDRGKLHMNFIFRLLETWAGRWTDYLIVHNRSDEEDARKLNIVPKDRLSFHPGVGIDLDYYSPLRVSAEEISAFRTQLQIPPFHKIVTMVSEFIPRKRHRDVIMAFALLKRTDIHLVLVGEGQLETETKQLVQKLGLANTIHFLGYRRDIPTLIHAANCTILASMHEGLPRSVMESLCLETPVIGSDVRGTRDLLAGGGGVTYPVGDVAKLAETIKGLLDNPEKARKMGKAGRASMMSYGLESILSLHEQLYRQVLGPRFPAAAQH